MGLEGKKALVVGAGISGIWAAKLLAAKGAEVVLNDQAQLDSTKFENLNGISLKGGGHRADIFENKDLIVLSPGVPTELEPIATLLSKAKKSGSEIIGETELAARFVTAPIIAVTGTNGKSTTTTLLAKMFELEEKKVFSGGNLGTPLCQYVLNNNDAHIIVLEVSSFQLEKIVSFKPFISIMLNISADHLDRYNSMGDYVEAKNRIFMNQSPSDYAIINAEDKIITKLSSKIEAVIVPFGATKKHRDGIFLKNKYIASEIDGHKVLFDSKVIESMGGHNLENCMAAIGAALLCDISIKSIIKGIEEFVGLPHRMEYVDSARNVSFYDDSKATNVGALIKSLETIENKVILIAGGKDKGGSYAPLKSLLRKNARALVLIGEAAQRMKESLGDDVNTLVAKDMEDAVSNAWCMAKEGDMVLLSPACSSFDMFSGYGERGDAFKKAVKKILSNVKKNNFKKPAVAH